MMPVALVSLLIGRKTEDRSGLNYKEDQRLKQPAAVGCFFNILPSF